MIQILSQRKIKWPKEKVSSYDLKTSSFPNPTISGPFPLITKVLKINGRMSMNPKDEAAKVLLSICQQIWKTLQWPEDWKRSVFIPIPKKGNAKEWSNYLTIAIISHASKVILKILQARLPQYVNRELPDVQAGFRKGRGTRDQIANIHWITKKAKEFQKNIYFCFIDCQSLWLCVS